MVDQRLPTQLLHRSGRSSHAGLQNQFGGYHQAFSFKELSLLCSQHRPEVHSVGRNVTSPQETTALEYKKDIFLLPMENFVESNRNQTP